MNPAFVGPYEVMITYAGEDAVSFFKNNGFTDDPILNARYSCESPPETTELFQISTSGGGLGIGMFGICS